MSATENTRSDATSVEFAVALGRIEEGQKHLKESVDGVREEVGGAMRILGEHAVEIGRLKTQQDQTERALQDAKPAKAPWTAIGALGVAALVFMYSVAERFFGVG